MENGKKSVGGKKIMREKIRGEDIIEKRRFGERRAIREERREEIRRKKSYKRREERGERRGIREERREGRLTL